MSMTGRFWRQKRPFHFHSLRKPSAPPANRIASVRPTDVGCSSIFFELSVHIVHTLASTELKEPNCRSNGPA